jgi:hypothetical protein
MNERIVYMVTSGSYSDCGVNAIFSTREKAQEFVELFPDSDCNGISEVKLDPECLEWKKSGRIRYRVLMLRDGTVEEAKQSEAFARYDFEGGGTIWNRSTAPAYIGRGIPDCLTATVWATDEKHAVKIANEIRTRMIANNEWPLPGE